ncbi:unnamed protein product [Trichobilharzia szidati]|nr:unnamed protein product [Trichobilharzia szidati]
MKVKSNSCVIASGMSSRNDIFQFLKSRGRLAKYYSKKHNRNSLRRVCFSTYEQIELYKRFPEVVRIDCTHNTNKEKYSLFQLVIMDNFGRGRPVLFAWTKKELKRDMIWILVVFRQIMGGTSRTETFIVDCAPSKITAVKVTHRQAHIVLCPFHVCRAFSKKTRNPLVKNYLCRLVHCEWRAEFNFYFRIISRLDVSVSQYIQRRWMSQRHLWARAFNGHVLTFGYITDNRGKNSHKQIKRYLQRSDSLHESMLKVYNCCQQSSSKIHQEAMSTRSRDSYSLPSTSEFILNNPRQAFSAYCRLINIYLEKIRVKFGERFAADYAGAVNADIERILNIK